MENRLSSGRSAGNRCRADARIEQQRSAFDSEAASDRELGLAGSRSRPPHGDLVGDRSRGLDYARLTEDSRRRDGGFTREWDQTVPVVTRGPSGPGGPGGGDRQENLSQRGRGPRTYRRSDDRIREDVCERLSIDRRVDASDIDVTISDAEITLDGTVDSSFTKRRAEDIAADTMGVLHVQNNLRAGRGPVAAEQIGAAVPKWPH